MRRNLEHEALQPFEEIAEKYGFHFYTKRDNRIFLPGKANFQFGDLRVNTLTHHVVIEIESAGGVTNLVKYWYCLALNPPPTQISLPIILIHVFQQTGPHSYEAHLNLWEFLWSEMQKALDDKKIRASKFTYHEVSDLEVSDLKPIHPAIHEFEKSLTSL